MAENMSEQNKVYVAARDGKVLTLYALLCHKSATQKRFLLSSATSENGQTTTPFIIAARNGHSKVLQLLLMQFQVDIEQTGTVKFDGFVIDKATALWCAAGAGHKDVVETLVKFKADVNHPTQTNSTPLRAACFDGHLEIVRFLVENGADMDIPNKFKNTCLMIACYKGHKNVVSYLLEMGANPNARAQCGATALHFAAERGNLPIVKELVKHGASLLPNDQSLTPLQIASECGRAEIVEFLVSQKNCSKRQRVEALELLGASCANDKDNYNIEKCYHYFWLALQERFSDPNNILEKSILPPIDAYENRQECITIQELEKIKDDHNAIHMEALMVRERLLGENNVEIPHAIIFRGAVFADNACFDKCILLWMRALKLRQQNKRSTSKDLLRFSQVFSQMLHVGVDVECKMVMKVFQHNLDEFEIDRSKLADASVSEDEKKGIRDVVDTNMFTALYLLVILTKLKCCKEEEYDMCKMVYRFNRMSLRLSTKPKFTPLHMACDEDTHVDDFHVNDIVKFPNDKLIKLLLKCGADANSLDEEGNTPLHIMVKYYKPISDFLTLHNSIAILLNEGCHIDRVNKKGETAFDTATTGVADIIMKTRRKLSLKCIAARAVKKLGIDYVGHIPNTLEEFVHFH